MRRHSRMRSSRGGVPSGARYFLMNLPRSRASWPCAKTFTDTSHVRAPNAVNRAGGSSAASKESARVALERADAASQPVYACANHRSRRGARGRLRGLRVSTSISSTSTGVRIVGARCRCASRRASRRRRGRAAHRSRLARLGRLRSRAAGEQPDRAPRAARALDRALHDELRNERV